MNERDLVQSQAQAQNLFDDAKKTAKQLEIRTHIHEEEEEEEEEEEVEVEVEGNGNERGDGVELRSMAVIINNNQ